MMDYRSIIIIVIVLLLYIFEIFRNKTLRKKKHQHGSSHLGMYPRTDVSGFFEFQKPKWHSYFNLINGELSLRNQDLDVYLIRIGLILLEQR